MLVSKRILWAWFWQFYIYELIADLFYDCWAQGWGWLWVIIHDYLWNELNWLLPANHLPARIRVFICEKCIVICIVLSVIYMLQVESYDWELFFASAFDTFYLTINASYQSNVRLMSTSILHLEVYTLLFVDFIESAFSAHYWQLMRYLYILSFALLAFSSLYIHEWLKKNI